MKKVLALLVIGLCAAFYSGCGKDTSTNADSIHDTLTINHYDTIRIYYRDTSGEMKWTVRPGIKSASSPIIVSLIFGGNLFVAVGGGNFSGDSGRIFTSPDGVTWTRQMSGTTPPNHGLNAVAWGQNTFVAVGDSGTILTSSDGSTWAAQNSGIYDAINQVVYGANKFLACTWFDTVLTSSNGASWTIAQSNLPIPYSPIAYGNNRFVTESIDSIYSSADGVTWTNTGGVTVGTSYPKTIWADSQFVMFGGELLTSSDGLAWISRGVVNGGSVAGIAWGNGKYVITLSGCNLSSLDGLIWYVEDGLLGYDFLLAYGAGKFVAVMHNGTVLTSDW
jgi:hypothetical protein